MSTKRRYSLTLTPENVQRFQVICKIGGLPASTMSNAVDDFLRDISPVMEQANSAGKFSVGDFFTFLGSEIEKVFEEEKHDEKRTKKTPPRKGN